MYYIQSMYKLRVIKPQKNKNKNKNCNMHICKFVTCRFQTFTPTYLLYTANIGTIISCHSKHSKYVSSPFLHYYAPHNLYNFILKGHTTYFELHYKKIHSTVLSNISEKLDFWWSIPQKRTGTVHINHLGARDEPTIRLSN